MHAACMQLSIQRSGRTASPQVGSIYLQRLASHCIAGLVQCSGGTSEDNMESMRTFDCIHRRAERDGGGGFTAGFFVGGAVFGVLGFLFAPQVTHWHNRHASIGFSIDHSEAGARRAAASVQSTESCIISAAYTFARVSALRFTVSPASPQQVKHETFAPHPADLGSAPRGGPEAEAAALPGGGGEGPGGHEAGAACPIIIRALHPTRWAAF